ncbi:MAG: ATP-binding cassette domain-containing protein [Thiolinea sp.]
MATACADVLDPRLRSGVLSRPAARTAVRLAAGGPAKPEATGQEADPQAVMQVTGLETVFEVGASTFQAVNGVDFQLRRQECLGLVGESGSGKSVTALSLMGLTPTPPGVITGGSVQLGEQALLTASLAELQHLRGNRVAYIFQDPLSTLHPLFSIGDQVSEAIRAHQPLSRRQAQQRTLELLDAVRIPNAASRLDDYPHQLSGGMRQRGGHCHGAGQ